MHHAGLQCSPCHDSHRSLTVKSAIPRSALRWPVNDPDLLKTFPRGQNRYCPRGGWRVGNQMTVTVTVLLLLPTNWVLPE
jgi:hypothetical protein